MFVQIDAKAAGELTLTEVEQGLMDVLQLPPLLLRSDLIRRAFETGQHAVRSRSQWHGADRMERAEFRLMLLYLKVQSEQ